jgi:S1-C subfamily serine protease
MKTLFAAVVTLVLACSASLAWDRDAMNRQIDQTNFIVARNCSGTLIDLKQKLILTNHHCIESFVKTTEREVADSEGVIKKVKREKLDDVPVVQRAYQGFETVGQATYVTRIVAHKQTRDLALLQIRADTIPQTLSSRVAGEASKAARGDHAFAVGNPNLLDATVTEGIISSVQRTFEFPWALGEKLPMLQYSGGLAGGSSGGALYNDGGELIGVPAAGYRSTTFLGLAIPASIIREFLAEFCFASAYDPAADDAKCRADREKKEKGDKSAFNWSTETIAPASGDAIDAPERLVVTDPVPCVAGPADLPMPLSALPLVPCEAKGEKK